MPRSFSNNPGWLTFHKGDAYLLKTEAGSYTVGKDTIRFGPGKVEHKWLTVRGGLTPMDAPSV